MKVIGNSLGRRWREGDRDTEREGSSVSKVTSLESPSYVNNSILCWSEHVWRKVLVLKHLESWLIEAAQVHSDHSSTKQIQGPGGVQKAQRTPISLAPASEIMEKLLQKTRQDKTQHPSLICDVWDFFTEKKFHQTRDKGLYIFSFFKIYFIDYSVTVVPFSSTLHTTSTLHATCHPHSPPLVYVHESYI